MKKIIVAAAIGSAFAASQAWAQARQFEGLSAGINLSGADTTAERQTGTVTAKGSDTDANFSLQLQYNTAVNEMLLLGFGASANFGDLKAGKLNPTNTLVKVKDAYSLYFAPGFAFGNGLLGYGKLAYINANIQNSSGANVHFDDGYGLGFGLQALFGKNWYGQAEFMMNQYTDKSLPGETDKLKAGVLSFGAGYRF
jgi:hypothetical protein